MDGWICYALSSHPHLRPLSHTHTTHFISHKTVCRSAPVSATHGNLPLLDYLARMFQRCTLRFRTSCDSCPKGKYTAEVATVVCQRCAKGRYSDTVESTGCKPCDVGTSNEAQGSTEPCPVCVVGKIAISIASQVCTNCTDGQYRNASMVATACSRCPAGTMMSPDRSTVSSRFSHKVHRIANIVREQKKCSTHSQESGAHFATYCYALHAVPRLSSRNVCCQGAEYVVHGMSSGNLWLTRAPEFMPKVHHRLPHRRVDDCQNGDRLQNAVLGSVMELPCLGVLRLLVGRHCCVVRTEDIP